MTHDAADVFVWHTAYFGGERTRRWLAAHGLWEDDEALWDWIFGVPDPVASGGVAHRSPELVLGAAPVKPHGKARFDIEDDGPWAVLQPVAEGGTVIDLVAWHPARPDKWRLLHGDGVLLGSSSLELQMPHDPPLVCYATPRAWLHGAAPGFCPLTFEPYSLQSSLILADRIMAANLEVAEKLEAALAYRRLPELRVATESPAAAPDGPSGDRA